MTTVGIRPSAPRLTETKSRNHVGLVGPPILAIDRLDTQSLEGEQRGFMNLLKGLYGTIRNRMTHNSRIEWDMTEKDALDILTTISLVHSKFNMAYRYRS